MDKAKFLSNIFPEPNTGCWLWAGRYDAKGYGRGHFLQRTVQLAHRYAYILYKGPITCGLHVLHKCDNPACVNPDHLFLGTQKLNNIDRDKKGRQRTKRGSEHRFAKFKPEDVRRIRQIHSPESMPSRQIAKIFNCSQKAVMNVINRKSYRNVL